MFALALLDPLQMIGALVMAAVLVAGGLALLAEALHFATSSLRLLRRRVLEVRAAASALRDEWGTLKRTARGRHSRGT